MKDKAHYTEAFREQALQKVYVRDGRTVKAVARGKRQPLNLKELDERSKEKAFVKSQRREGQTPERLDA